MTIYRFDRIAPSTQASTQAGDAAKPPLLPRPAPLSSGHILGMVFFYLGLAMVGLGAYGAAAGYGVAVLVAILGGFYAGLGGWMFGAARDA